MSTNCSPSLLIVEDDPIIYRDLITFFQSKGYPVATPPDGSIVDSYEAGLEVARTQKPDIAILDIELNGKHSGLQLGKELANVYKMPVLFLTGYDTAENRRIGNTIAEMPLFSKIDKIEDNEMILKSLEYLYHKFIVVKDDDSIVAKSIKAEVDQKSYNTIKELENSPIKRSLLCRDICFLSSYNKKLNKKSNNHVILHKDNYTGYRIYGNLTRLIAQDLPKYFVRISDSVIVSLRHLTDKDYKAATCTVNGYNLYIEPTYREEAIRRIQEYFNDY